MKALIRILTVILLFSWSTVAFPDNLADVKPRKEKSTIEKMDDYLSKNYELTQDKNKSQKTNSIIPKMPPLTIEDEKTKSYYLKSMQAYYGYKIRGFEHRSRVFEWQLFSSKMLFVIVLVLVFSGIYFAAVQFYAGLKGLKNNEQKSKVSVSPKGIEVSSPVICVIILALSLGFFYLDLVYVFPIEEIF